MSDAIRPENAEDVVQQVASDDAIAAAMPDVPPCPSIAGIIFEQFPEIQEILDIVNTGIGAALAVFDTVSALDPTAQSNQAKSGLSGAKEKAIRAVEKAAKEIKEEAEAVATAAYEAAKAEVTKLEEMIEAIGQGIIDIGTDLENIDEITLNAIEAQFPGFKNALECLNGLADSGAAMANGDGAKKQINTPPPDNPAIDKEDTNPKREPDEGEDVGEPNEELSKLEAGENLLNKLLDLTGLVQGSVDIEVPNG